MSQVMAFQLRWKPECTTVNPAINTTVCICGTNLYNMTLYFLKVNFYRH